MRTHPILRWLPAVVIMAVIFIASNTPSSGLPQFGSWDFIVKKAGHMTGYALLALSFWFGLGFNPRRWWLAILLALLYAAIDEYHQSFISGRHPSLRDVLLFDGGGASIAVALMYFFRSRKKP